MLTIFIDGDPVAFKSAHYAATLPESITNARRSIEKLAATLKADRIIVAKSDPSRRYFRHKLWPAYKDGRRDYPEFVAETLAAIGEHYSCRQLPGLESDDVLGILATHPGVTGDRIIVADDKDLLTVPGHVYRPARKESLYISRAEADYRHILQTLTGDSGDGYPGCPGIGDKRAAAVVNQLMSPGEQWAAVVTAFESKGLTENDAVIQGQLARILQTEDYDLEQRQVRLWNPPAIERKECAA